MSVTTHSPAPAGLDEGARALNDVNISAVAALANGVRSEPQAGATTWRATVTWQGGFRASAQVRGFEPFASDEPSGLGGHDTAPNPVEQLLAALGNCLVVGYAANATADGIAIRDLRIDVEGDLDLAAFLGLRDGHAGFDTIRASVHLDTDATAEQLRSLHEAVTGTSPVGHTLQASIPVRIALA
jgi:uncharacterized OsmC-like protein